MARIERVRVPPPAARGPPPNDVERILQTIPRTQPRDRLLFGLIASTGLRAGEALALYIEDLDLTADDEHLSVLSKGERRRTVLLDDPQLVALLRRYLKATGYRHGPLFRAQKNSTGGPLSYQSAQRRWATYCAKAGITATLPSPAPPHARDRARQRRRQPRHDPQTPRPQEPPDHPALRRADRPCCRPRSSASGAGANSPEAEGVGHQAVKISGHPALKITPRRGSDHERRLMLTLDFADLWSEPHAGSSAGSSPSKMASQGAWAYTACPTSTASRTSSAFNRPPGSCR